MRRFILLFIIMASCSASAQPIRQNPEVFIGKKSSVTVGATSSTLVGVNIGTTQGILMRVIVQGAGAVAGASDDFSVRICQSLDGSSLCTETSERSIYQREHLDSTGNYPHGLYEVFMIWFQNLDSPSRLETLWVRITNDSASSSDFDIILSGIKTEQD